MMSSPPPVGQGWHLPLEVVQPRSGGCESLQSTVVCDHPMVHVQEKGNCKVLYLYHTTVNTSTTCRMRLTCHGRAERTALDTQAIAGP